MELPRTYNENMLILLVQDPHVLFAYWQLSRGQWLAIGGRKLYLRLYDLGQNEVSLGASWREVSLPPYTNDWYFRDVMADHAYVTEVGYYVSGEQFYPLLRSNRAVTPRISAGIGLTLPLKMEAIAVPEPEPHLFWEPMEGTYSSLNLYIR